MLTSLQWCFCSAGCHSSPSTSWTPFAYAMTFSPPLPPATFTPWLSPCSCGWGTSTASSTPSSIRSSMPILGRPSRRYSTVAATEDQSRPVNQIEGQSSSRPISVVLDQLRIYFNNNAITCSHFYRSGDLLNLLAIVIMELTTLMTVIL